MQNGSQLLPERAAPVVAGSHHAFSIMCPACRALVSFAVEADAETNGDSPSGDRCAVCHELIVGRGRGAVYCGASCCNRAYRRRQRGVPQDAFPHGGARGKLRLDQLTRAEQEALALVVAERH